MAVKVAGYAAINMRCVRGIFVSSFNSLKIFNQKSYHCQVLSVNRKVLCIAAKGVLIIHNTWPR